MTGAVAQQTQARHHPYIDCARGYAVLLVITTHLTYFYPSLPYPVHRLTTLGWHGVQLFFMASAVTLMMSWHANRARNGAVDLITFYLRRFFRVAPAYYAAAALYFFLTPPPSGVELPHLLGWLLFLNDWHPGLGSELMGAWAVVPGGWSISAEFSFYALFPIVATFITSLRRAVWAAAAVCMVVAMINMAALAGFAAYYDTTNVDIFLYFWCPNQLPVFACGVALFFVLNGPTAMKLRLVARRHPALPGVLAAAATLAFLSLGYQHPARWFSLIDPRPPALLQASLAFAIFLVALMTARPGLLVNRVIAHVGKVSFSAYLLHYAVIDAALRFMPGIMGTGALNYAAIAAFVLGWLIVAALTVGAATLTYHLIEAPGVALGHRVISRRCATSLP